MPTPDTKLLQGTLDMLILKALSLGPLHGYGIGQRIMQTVKGARPDTGEWDPVTPPGWA